MSSDDQTPSWTPGQLNPQWAGQVPAVEPAWAPDSPPPPPRQRLNSRGIAVVTVAALLLAAGGYAGWRLLGTTDKAKGAASPTPTVTPPLRGTSWTQTKMHPVTAPVAVGDSIVVYTADAGVLTLRIINPASGTTTWSAVASPSHITPGEPFEVAHKGSVVYFYAPVGQPRLGLAALNAVDVNTKKLAWSSPRPHSFADMPGLCSDGLALCVSAYTKGVTATRLRVTLADGVEKVISTQGGRALGDGVTDPGGRTPEYIQHVDDTTGRVVWKVPVAQLFGSPVSSDGGWNWDHYGSRYVGWTAATRSLSAPTASFANERTVGVDAATGARVWEKPGVYGCPVQGVLDNGNPIPVRCLVKGTITFHPGGNPTFVGLDVTMQGFNPRTGATTWSARLGNAPAALGIASANGLVRVGGHVFALTDASGHTKVLDLVTGKVTAPDATTPAWCLSGDVTWDWAYAPSFHGKKVKFVTQGLASPCSETRKSITAADGTLVGVGATAGGYFVWSSPDGLHGLKTT